MKLRLMTCLVLFCLGAGSGWASTRNLLGRVEKVQPGKDGAPVLVLQRLWDSYGTEFEGTMRIGMERAVTVTLNGAETPATEAAKVGRTVQVTINRQIPKAFAFVDVAETDRALMRQTGGDVLVATGARVVPGSKYPHILELTLALRDGAVADVAAISTGRIGRPLEILKRELNVADGKVTGTVRLAVPAHERDGKELLPAVELTMNVDLPVAGGKGTLNVEGERPAPSTVEAFAVTVPAKQSAVWIRVNDFGYQASLVVVDDQVVPEKAHLLHSKGFIVKDGITDVSGNLKDGVLTLSATIANDRADTGAVTISGHLIGDRLIGTIIAGETKTPCYGGVLPCSAVPGGAFSADH